MDLRGGGNLTSTVSSGQLGWQFACRWLADLFRKPTGIRRRWGHPEEGPESKAADSHTVEMHTGSQAAGKTGSHVQGRDLWQLGSVPQVTVVISVLLIIEQTNGAIFVTHL